jgi:hypothetical protein
MVADEIRNLRYCYEVLCRRIADEDDGLAYWQMNLRLATFFLRRYDPEFDPEHWHHDDVLTNDQQQHLARAHPLLQRRATHRTSYPKLTKELQRNLERRVARYLQSR